MSKDAKEWCLLVLIAWLLGSGIISCGLQLFALASFLCRHVKVLT